MNVNVPVLTPIHFTSAVTGLGGSRSTKPYHTELNTPPFELVITRFAMSILLRSVGPNRGATEKPTSMEPASDARRPDGSGTST